MLADAVESASRTLSEPTAKRIETLVHEITMAKLLDGQFDESSLTLSEIHEIEDSLTKSLIGIYHGRIQYPEQRTAASSGFTSGASEPLRTGRAGNSSRAGCAR